MNKVTQDIYCVGVNDHETDLFEGMFTVPNGMAYNSYVIKDEKIAVTDSVDFHYRDKWLENIEEALGGDLPDYIIVTHMEPDHSANIKAFTDKYPNAKIIGNVKTFVMLSEYFGDDFADKKIVVGDGDTLSLGKHVLKFVFAPLVHWPEVMVAYDLCDKVLFSADAFGKFGALDIEEEWEDEARRYYFGIVGKFGVQVQNLLKKAAALDIKIICPLHGPVLKENVEKYISFYDKWSKYEPETDGVMIAYTSVYGHTKAAAEELYNILKERGTTVAIYDLARSSRSRCVGEAFKYSKLVLASTTYNGGVFPAMREFIECLTERNYRNRKVALIENGSWAPVAAKDMSARLEKCKGLEFAETEVKIRSALNEQSKAALAALADELCK